MRGLRLPAPLRGIVSIVGGSVAGQGVVILSYPLLTRLYDPSEFGLLTVFTSTVTLVAVLSTAALDGAIPLPLDDRDGAAVAWAALMTVAFTSLVTAVVWVLAADPITALLGVPQLAGYWWLAALTVLAMGSYEVLTDWMVRGRTYGALGRRNVIQGIAQAVTQVGLGLAGVRPVGLLLGFAVGRFASLWGLASRGGLLRQPRPTFRTLRATVSRFRRFPLLALPSAFVNRAGLEVPLLLTSAIYGDARAGLLGLTVRVISGPLGTIGQAVYQVFAGESSAAVRDPRGTLGAGVRGSVRRLLLVGLLPAAALIGFGPELFGLVFGPEWAEAGEYARVLAVAYLAQFAVVPVSATLFLLERQGQELAWAAARLLLTTAGPVVCGLVDAPITAAIAALAAGQVISYVVLYRLCTAAADASDTRYRDRMA
jgi:O-antigen/teichoic acid export membrane protein